MLETDAILLRACEPHDLPVMYEWENNTAYWLLSDTTKPFSKYTMQEFILQDQNDIYNTRQQRFVIQLKENEKAIGFIDLYQYDPSHQRAGVGILIGDETERHKGYALMSLLCLMQYAHDVLNMHQLYCYIQTSNKKSIGLFQRAGFTTTGILKDWLQSKNVFEDVILCQKKLM
jgi:diamine N-acetyltransferase